MLGELANAMNTATRSSRWATPARIGALLGVLLAIGVAHAADIRPAQVYEVRAATLRVRAAPSLNAAIIRKLTKRSRVLTADTQGAWVKIYAPGEPEFGWVDARYLKPVE